MLSPQDRAIFGDRTVLFNATTTLFDYGTLSAKFNANVPLTMLALIRPTGSGEGTFGYVAAKTDTSLSTGLRWFVDHNGGSPKMSFGQASGDNNPLRSAPTNSITYNRWVWVAVSSLGTITATDIKLYQGEQTIKEVASYSTTTNGTGSLNNAATYRWVVGNRDGGDRTFAGDIAMVVRWNAILSAKDLNAAITLGPRSVLPHKQIFCWVGGTDLGPQTLPPATVTARALGRNRRYTIETVQGPSWIAEVAAGSGALTTTIASSFSHSGTLGGTGDLATTSAAAFTSSATLAGAGELASTIAAIFAHSGTLSGGSALTTTVAAAFSSSGTLDGAGALLLTSAAAFTHSGTLAGSGGLLSTIAPAFTLTATVAGDGALTTSIPAVFAHSGTITNADGDALSTTIAASFGCSATLTASAAASTTIASAFTHSGVVAGNGALLTTAASTFGVSGTITGTSPSGELTTSISASFAASPTLSAAAALSTTTPAAFGVSGTIANIGAGAGALTTTIAAQFSVVLHECFCPIITSTAATFRLTGVLSGKGALTATAAGTFAMSSTLTGILPGAAFATIPVAFTVSGVLAGRGALNTTIAASFGASGTVKPYYQDGLDTLITVNFGAEGVLIGRGELLTTVPMLTSMLLTGGSTQQQTSRGTDFEDIARAENREEYVLQGSDDEVSVRFENGPKTSYYSRLNTRVVRLIG